MPCLHNPWAGMTVSGGCSVCHTVTQCVPAQCACASPLAPVFTCSVPSLPLPFLPAKQATSVRVRVLNPNNAAASQEVANRVLGQAALTKPAANQWTASIGTGGTATAPIPRAGIWRFQVALVSRRMGIGMEVQDASRDCRLRMLTVECDTSLTKCTRPAAATAGAVPFAENS